MSSDADVPPTRPVTTGPETLGDGRYRVHHRLGSGGMGLVVQATDTRLGREVAIKLLADNLAADRTARERFLREAQAAAALSDPHIVQVHDVDEEHGRPYLVMEHVDGPSLADVLATDGPLGPQEVTEVAADALAGIGRAHAEGVLHRDIKPGNLLRAPNGLIKVTDFGVAHAGDAPQLTRTGMVIGTAPYLAPERAAGQPATTRTDLYALGCTLYELLTGRPPAGDSPVADLEVELPAALSLLLDRLLARDPRLRPASAETALTLLAGEVTPPRGTPAGGPPPPAPPADAGPPPSHVAPSHDVDTVADAAARPTGADPAARPTGADPAGQPTGVGSAAGTADETAALEASVTPDGHAEAPADTARSPQVSWGVVIGAAIVLLLVAMVFQGLRGDDVGAPTGVERTDDPAETARNLADWLQERAGE